MDNKMEKKKVFWKIYITVYSAIILVVVIGWIVLWSFLNAYEKSQPEQEVNKIVEEFTRDNVDFLMYYINDEPSNLENDEMIRNYISNKIGEGNWEFNKELGAYTKESPVYQLKKDGNKVAVVYLSKQDTKGAFRTPKWQLEKVDGIFSEAMDYEIKVPKGSKVSVNGFDLDASYIVEDDAVCENLGNVTKYIDTPKMTIYKVYGLLLKPEITALGPIYSNCLEVEKEEDNRIEYAFEQNDSFIQSQEERIKEITRLYGNYVTNDIRFSSLSPYILSGSYAYSYLRKLVEANMWYAPHSSTEFQNMTVFNYQIYSDICFSCEVTFKHVVHRNSQDFEYPTHLKYIFVKSSGTWYVADISLK
jgi:hypothetical protein